jgi:hypothetical protein
MNADEFARQGLGPSSGAGFVDLEAYLRHMDPRTHPPAPVGIEPPHLEPGNMLARHASPISLLVLSTILAIGLSGVLGKPTTETTVHDGRAELAIDMPASVRNGDFYETRIRVKAKSDIGKLQIEVSPALWREITVNSMMPSPASEDVKGGYFRFEFAEVAAGDDFLLKVASQVNPRLFGSVSGHIRVLDDGVVLADAERTMKVFP